MTPDEHRCRHPSAVWEVGPRPNPFRRLLSTILNSIRNFFLWRNLP